MIDTHTPSPDSQLTTELHALAVARSQEQTAMDTWMSKNTRKNERRYRQAADRRLGATRRLTNARARLGLPNDSSDVNVEDHAPNARPTARTRQPVDDEA